MHTTRTHTMPSLWQWLDMTKEQKTFWNRKYYWAHREEKMAASKKWKEDHKEELTLKRKHFWKHHPFKELMRAVNANAKKRGSPEKITYLDLYSLAKQQKCRCALTGDKLTRDNISADHIVPLSKGGNNVIENLRLTTYDVNIVKNSLSDSEFLLICNKVVDHMR